MTAKLAGQTQDAIAWALERAAQICRELADGDVPKDRAMWLLVAADSILEMKGTLPTEWEQRKAAAMQERDSRKAPSEVVDVDSPVVGRIEPTANAQDNLSAVPTPAAAPASDPAGGMPEVLAELRDAYERLSDASGVKEGFISGPMKRAIEHIEQLQAALLSLGVNLGEWQ